MDRFDKLTNRPVRVTVSIEGFDLERALKQHQKRRTDAKRTAQQAKPLPDRSSPPLPSDNAQTVFAPTTKSDMKTQPSDSTEAATFHIDL